VPFYSIGERTALEMLVAHECNLQSLFELVNSASLSDNEQAHTLADFCMAQIHATQ